ncbi:4635_t:CDS:10 [Acaulospora colombiana]|uniref:4635_t:CDS:1 n=1 Tax=Acaulospora colombiana TaxID=27376 RepID=A0ACA9JV57_9GLOM|nr:4635_t:CDS:10 [Acaulospora colombiana]
MKVKLSNANFPKTADGRVYHVGVKRGEVGDMNRAQLFARWLDKDAPMFQQTSSRGFFTLTGKYKGEPVSVVGIGMGLPMMDFFVREVRAITDGPLIIIRFGSCGSIGKSKVGDMVVPRGSFSVTRNFDYFLDDGDESVGSPYNLSKVCYADPEICELLQHQLLHHLPSNEIHTGLNASCDSFYSSQGRKDENFTDDNQELFKDIIKKHPEAESLEMETFMLYHLARCSSNAPLISKNKNSNEDNVVNEKRGIKRNLNGEGKENGGKDVTEINSSSKIKNSIRAAALMMVFTDRKTNDIIDPDRVNYLESVGKSLYTLDVDLLKTLNPDIIITQDLCNVCSIDLNTVRRIVKQMNPVPSIVTLNPFSIEVLSPKDVISSINTVGVALGMESESSKVISELRSRIKNARDLANESNRSGRKRARVAFFEWTSPIYLGGHWTPQIIRWSNAISPQDVISENPEILIVCPCGLDLQATKKEYEETLLPSDWWPQLANNASKIALVDGNQMFNRSGPRLVDALEWLVGYINDIPEIIPEKFPWKNLKS